MTGQAGVTHGCVMTGQAGVTHGCVMTGQAGVTHVYCIHSDPRPLLWLRLLGRHEVYDTQAVVAVRQAKVVGVGVLDGELKMMPGAG